MQELPRPLPGVEPRTDLLKKIGLFVWSKRSLFLLAGISALYWLSLNPALYTWGDNAHYIIVGKSIATGQGFRDIHYPGDPYFAFPIPLFPLLLAPVIYFFGYSLLPLKIFVAVFGIGGIYLFYRYLKNRLNPFEAFLLAWFVGVSPQIVSFTHQVMSEIPYLFFSMLALVLVERYSREKGWLSQAGLLAAVSLAAVPLTRTLGFALVFAAMIFILHVSAHSMSTRLKKAGLLLVVCLAAWILLNVHLIDDNQYLREFFSASPRSGMTGSAGIEIYLTRAIENIKSYGNALSETILYRTYQAPAPALLILFLLLIGLGVLASWMKHRSIVEYYCFFYTAMILLYEPSNMANVRRYFVPIIPFLAYYFWIGLRQTVYWLSRFAESHWRELPGEALRREKETAFSLFHQDAGKLRMLGAEDGALNNVRGPRSASNSSQLLAAGIFCLFLLANLTSTVQASVLRTEAEMFDYYPSDSWEDYKNLASWAKDNIHPESITITRMIYFYHFWSQGKVDWYPSLGTAATNEHILRAIDEKDAEYIVVDSMNIDRTSVQRTFMGAVEASPEYFQLLHQVGNHKIYQVLAKRQAITPEVPLITQEIRYRIPGAGQVFIVWGINGWNLMALSNWPEGTIVQDAILFTPMVREDDTFVAKIGVPAGSTIDYAFQVTKTSSGQEVNLWDTNGAPGRDYHTMVLEAAVTEVESPLFVQSVP